MDTGLVSSVAWLLKQLSAEKSDFVESIENWLQLHYAQSQLTAN